MNTEQEKMLKNYEESGRVEIPCRNNEDRTIQAEEQPKMLYLLSALDSKIESLFEIKNSIKQACHRIYDTNVPEKSGEEEMPNANDAISFLERQNVALDILRDELYKIREKLNNLI